MKSVEVTAWIPLVTVMIALIGAVFAALRFNREDASAVVAQQSTVLADMKALNDELATAAQRVRIERDELLTRIVSLTSEVNSLRSEVGMLRDDLHRERSRGGRRGTDR